MGLALSPRLELGTLASPTRVIPLSPREYLRAGARLRLRSGERSEGEAEAARLAVAEGDENRA